ncbi:MFS transporter [Nocardia arizonensis]|uniref:MFS transporter n=2 Tax=Nocardia arizonensis TaxID=1141647 RepID=UPI0007A7380F|nr:MFS transporter [Nocardia arizonensis]
MALRQALLDIAPLRDSPGFRRLWIGRTLSGFGGQIAVVAVMFQAWQTTHSAVWTGAIGMARAVPLIAFGLFAGSLVDSTDRRRLYLITTACQALCALVLASQGLFGAMPVVALLAVVAVQSCFVAGGGPASRTFVAHLLPRTQLAAGLALNRITMQAAMLAGPALGGLLLGWLGSAGCYLIDAVTFGLAFRAAMGLPAMPPGDDASRPGLAGVRDGLAFLIGNPAVRGALLTDVATTVLSMPISLFPLVNAERFGDDPRTLGLFLSAVAVGGTAASVLSGTFTRLPRPGLVMLGGSAVWGASLALFGLVSDPWIGLGFLVVAGAADTVAVVSRSAIVQLHTPNGLLGRVAAAELMVGQAGPDVGNMRAGIVAGHTSGPTALVSGGLLCLAAVVAIWVSTPALRHTTVGTNTGDTRRASPDPV